MLPVTSSNAPPVQEVLHKHFLFVAVTAKQSKLGVYEVDFCKLHISETIFIKIYIYIYTMKIHAPPPLKLLIYLHFVFYICGVSKAHPWN